MPNCDARSVALAHEAAARAVSKLADNICAAGVVGAGTAIHRIGDVAAQLVLDCYSAVGNGALDRAKLLQSCPAATVPPEGDAGEWPTHEDVRRLKNELDCDRDLGFGTMLSAISSIRQWLASLPPRQLPPPSDAACLELINTIYQHSYVESDSAGSYTAIRAAFAAWAKGGQR